mgnify:CR=1 FL=1
MVTWKKICAGMLSAALLTGAATTTFAAEEQSDKTVTLYNQPGAPLPEAPKAATTTAAVVPAATTAAAEAPQKVELADKLVINLAARSLAAVRNNQKVALYPIGPGKTSTPTRLDITKSSRRKSIRFGRILAILRIPSRRALRIRSAIAGSASAATTASMARTVRILSATMYRTAASACMRKMSRRSLIW